MSQVEILPVEGKPLANRLLRSYKPGDAWTAELITAERDSLRDIRRRFQFFLDSAGYSTPPGRAACALHLARAEMRAEAEGLTVETEPDWDVDLSWDEDPPWNGYTRRRLESGEFIACVVTLKSPDGETLGALGGVIASEQDSYWRVVAAELAAEHYWSADMQQQEERERLQRIAAGWSMAHQTRLSNCKPRWHVHEFDISQVYGGSEEGGWWFDSGNPTGRKLGPFDCEETAIRYCRGLNDVENNRQEEEEDYGYTSVLSYRSNHYSWRVENSAVAYPYPANRPHYE